jgi:SAM-dependent methyltransferase
LLRRGFDACGAEPVAAMRELAAAALRRAGFPPDGRLFDASLPALAGFADAEFDAVLCSAVLMHLPEECLFDAVYGLRRVLRPRGRLLLSLPAARPGIDPLTRRDPGGRLFTDLPPARAQLLFERAGFVLVSIREVPDSLGRPGHSWTLLDFALADRADQPLNLVESILRRDGMGK